MSIPQLLRLMAQSLAALPSEVSAAIWRLIIALLLLFVLFLRFLWKLVEGAKDDKEHDPPRPNHCCEVPPNIKRKPDPCLYSQFYLIAQGRSVTWDNPDIWLTLPNGIPVPSGELQPKTEYLVHARIHDASFDPALATEVRCLYRPWSFNSPHRIPIEVNADGTERVIVIHIPPWQSETVVFRWKTPDEPNKHWCIQVECQHPDDKNPNNNLGQENTQVLGGTQAMQVSTGAMLANPTDRRILARIAMDQYVIPTGTIALKLDTLTRHLQRKQPGQFLRRLMVTRDSQGNLRSYGTAGPVMISYAYRGFHQLRPENDRGAKPLDPAWNATVNGELVRPAAFVEIDLAPRASVDIPISLTVPSTAAPGSRHAFNVIATTDRGKLLGGLTLGVEVA